MYSWANMRYIIATHTSYQNGVEIHGPAHTIYSFLKEKGLNSLFIRHPLNPRKDDIYILKNGENDRKIRTISSISALDNIFELLVNAYEVLKVREEVYFVGIDPLNALSGILCRLFFWKKIKVVYYIVDFSDTRFKNKLMNSVYTLLDKISCKYSSEVWCVSTRICRKKIEQGIDKDKVKFVPNSPSIKLGKSVPQYNGNHNCIIVGALTDYICYPELLETISIVKKTAPSIKLNIIGDGEKKSVILKQITDLGLEQNVKLLGSLSHERVMEQMSNSFIGIALYSGKATWNGYGDSMKTREFQAFGLPVIINRIPSNSDEVSSHDAGLVIDEDNINAMAQYIVRLLLDEKLYVKTRFNSYKLAKMNDKSLMLSQILRLT